MSDKAILKRYNGLDFTEVYPKTTHDQIIASGTPLSTTFLSGTGVWATPQGTSNHSHGNISSAGVVSTNTFPTSGQKIVMTDGLNQIIQSQISIGTNTSLFLRNDGFWTTPPSGGGSTYSSASLYIKRVWSKAITATSWTNRYNAGTGTGILISTNATFTFLNLGYTGASTDMYMIEFSNSTNNGLEKGVAHIGSGTFSSTAGMAVISYDAYENVVNGQLRIAKYFAQVQKSSTGLNFRYGSKVVV